MKARKVMLFTSVFALTAGLGAFAQAAESSSVPELTVTSDILGMADTGGKTTLKVDLVYEMGAGDYNLRYYDENGERTIYENQEEQCIAMDPVTYTGSAVMDLGSEVDDSLIDSSNAVVQMLDGNGYHANEFILSDAASSLDGEWSNGQYVYTLDVGDIEWNTWGYDTSADYNSGREWSIMGGDGSGGYFFTFEVSGITYDGEEIAPVTFPVDIYIYGRSCTDLALSTEYVDNPYDPAYTSGLEPADEIQWDWYTENETSVEHGKPYLNDEYSDYFSIVWPEGTDASDITAEDVTVTLYSVYGDEYTLSEETEYGEHEYTVLSSETETVVIVTYQQWAFIPVYSTMEITVDNGDLTASASYDICSVYAYQVETGGGGTQIDHTSSIYNFYGITDLTIDNAANIWYALRIDLEDEDGEMVTYYYAEDEDGNGYLVEGVDGVGGRGETITVAPEDAWFGDGTDIYHIAVIENCVFTEKRMDTDDETVTTEVKVVDGEEMTFRRDITIFKETADVIASGATLVDGYNCPVEGPFKWAWTRRYQAGWTIYTPQPDSLPYVEGHYPYGYEPGSSNPIYDNLEEE